MLTEEETELGADEQGVGVPRALGSLIDSEQLAKSTAGALVLLLTGAHLRRWLGATPGVTRPSERGSWSSCSGATLSR